MYTWGYIKEAALAKMDMSVEDAINMGLINKMPFYANEAVTYITASIKARRTYADFDIRDFHKTIRRISEKFHLEDVSFLFKKPCDKTTLNLDEGGALTEFEQHLYTQTPISFPNDFFAWSDDINYKFDKCEKEWKEASDRDYTTYGSNKIMFNNPGLYRMAYLAKWFKILPTTDDDYELDCPDDILECIPTYIASQLYKIDDEVKSGILRNEWEMAISRIDENDYSSNKIIKDRGEW